MSDSGGSLQMICELTDRIPAIAVLQWHLLTLKD